MTDTERLTAALADRYVIERELGQGGMATVYLAHDVKHDRKVAVKVLRPELAAVLGAERFVQEIKTTAALQHPHILPLFDSGTADGFLFYVMPYIEGETLRDRLNRETQLGVDEAVRLTTEVADALDYAHRRGVIHRDIKPENILLHDGRPMVADFGIALALSAAAGGRMTETGMSLGTPHYMSPEQATADKDITNRSDIYSLGSVLYEMLTGDPPHTGSSAQQIIMKIVTEEAAPVTKARKNVPPNVTAAVAQALEKVPADRFESAKAFAEALQNPGFTTAGAAAATGPGAGRRAPSHWMGWAVAAVLGVAALWGWTARPAPASPGEPVRFTLDLADEAGYQGVGAGGLTSNIVISPDGRTIVYVGRGDPETQLYRRSMDRLAWEALPGTNDADSPFFSPDGRWVGFRQGNRLRKIELATGAVVTLATLDRSSLVVGATWSRTDTIYVALEAIGGLFRLSAEGGPLERFVTSDTTSLFWWPELLPGEEWLLVSRTSLERGRVRIVAAVSLATGEVRRLVDGGFSAQYVPGQRMVYLLADGTMVTAPLDPADPQPTTERTPIVERIARNTSGGAHFSVARNGTAVFLTGGSAENTIVFVDRTGRETPVLDTPRDYKDPRFSPDGRLLAYVTVEGNEGDLWVSDVDRATAPRRLTFDSDNLYPVWTPNGRRIAFTSRRGGIAELWWKAADGSGDAEVLLSGPELRFPGSFTPDGNTLLYRETAPQTGFDIYALPIADDRTPRAVVVSPFHESSPTLSRDGRWMAFVSDQSGQNQVYVRAFPDGATDHLVSAGGGVEPVWDPDARRLYYRRGGTLMQATLVFGDRVGVERRDSLFTGNWLENVRWPEYDIHPDGDRFVFVKLGRPAIRPVVVLNWAEELRRRTERRSSE